MGECHSNCMKDEEDRGSTEVCRQAGSNNPPSRVAKPCKYLEETRLDPRQAHPSPRSDPVKQTNGSGSRERLKSQDQLTQDLKTLLTNDDSQLFPATAFSQWALLSKNLEDIDKEFDGDLRPHDETLPPIGFCEELSDISLNYSAPAKYT